MNWNAEYLAIGAALAVGLLIGIERGWNLRQASDGTRVAGVRTFTLLGLMGGLSGLLSENGQECVAGALFAAAAVVLAIGYFKTVAPPKSDATTAIAGLLTLALGFVAGSGNPALSIACAAVVTLTLALRSELHSLIEKLEEQDVKALARFAVIAVAVLPFLPSGIYGPYGAWDLQKLWLVVVLVTGFSFIGYIANRIVGVRHGTIVTALIGGAYSSTAVTQSLAQRLGSGGGGGGAEPAGIALATLVMYIRVLILVSVLATSVFLPLMVIILPALITAAVAGFWLYQKSSASDGAPAPGNPIALLPALAFVAFVAAAAVAARWAEGRFGEQGIAILILIMGSMDVDAAIVTVGGLEVDAISPALAALALGGTVLANMTVKLGITIAYARAKGKSAAIALGASMLVLAGSLGVGLVRLV